MRVLSLFDGISCGQLALQRANVPVEVYYASEIDKYAIQITQKNFPNTIQLGDVNKIDFTKFIGKIDMVIGGSPCQDLSIAKQDRKGLKGERSGLFYKFVEAIRIIKPKYFLLENVASMSKGDKEIITKEFKAYPVMINSALVSAQQRKRMYWCNWHVNQPKDKGIVLKNILESGQTPDEKSRAIISSIGRTTEREYFRKNQGQMAFESIMCVPEGTKKGYAEIKQNECVDLTQLSSQTRRGRSMVDKSNCLTCQSQFYQYIGQIRKRQQSEKVYSVKNKSISGVGVTNLTTIDLPDGEYLIRKLSPIECERLQTLPDNYTEGISDTQRYKTIGNGWTVDVIAHIFRNIGQEKEKYIEQLDLF